jgi:hypothetical protein
MANPQIASARRLGNLSSSNYHSMPVEDRQRAKGLGDEDGEAQEQNDSFRT